MAADNLSDLEDVEELPSTHEFCLEIPLYRTFQFDVDEQNALSELEFYKGTIDCYCHGCQRHSVLDCAENEYVRRFSYDNHIFPLSFICTRDRSHITTFLFRAHEGTVQKIGQYPSLGDLVGTDLQKYRPVLTNEHYRELVRGVGLASHDVGIGAFIYLRRVFEHLIESAHLKFKDSPGWDESAFEQARIDEKIQILKSSLPQFLVENRVLYKILSSGVHELSEEECLKIFPAVKIGIELILDDELERHKRDKKIQSAKEALNQTAQKLKRSK
ncbi:MAG TPA: short-chain dehydrogenase [Verrucomicrobiae bacterium]|nr:short-chain dehydrogenase [Verrucomicrobiae bacterium]